jgi:hypothetical protein
MNSELLQFALLFLGLGVFGVWVYKNRRKQEPQRRDLSLFDFEDSLENPGFSDPYL